MLTVRPSRFARSLFGVLAQLVERLNGIKSRCFFLIFSHVISRPQIDVFRGEAGPTTSSHVILKQPMFTPSGYQIGLQNVRRNKL